MSTATTKVTSSRAAVRPAVEDQPVRDVLFQLLGFGEGGEVAELIREAREEFEREPPV
jgi:hypothetical protein